MEEWLLETTGKTKSGRMRDVRTTQFNFLGLFELHQEKCATPISINPFARLCNKLHIHFGIGTVDVYTCEACRLVDKSIAVWKQRADEFVANEKMAQAEECMLEAAECD